MDNLAGGSVPAAGTLPVTSAGSHASGISSVVAHVIPSPIDRIPAVATLISTVGVAILVALRAPSAVAGQSPAAFPLLAIVFWLAGILVVRLGPGAFPIVIGVRSTALLIGLLVAPAIVVVAAHAVGGTLAVVSARPRDTWPAAARLSTAVLGTAIGATVYQALLVAGSGSLAGWWLASFVAALAATCVGSIGLAIEWLAGGSTLSARHFVTGGIAAVVVSTTAASIGLTVVIFSREDPTELLLLVGPAVVAVLACGAYAAQRGHHQQVEFLYRSARVLDGASSGAAMVTELLEGLVAQFEAERAELVLDRIGDRPVRASVTRDGVVDPVGPVEPEVASQAISLLETGGDGAGARGCVVIQDPHGSRAVVRLATSSRPVGVIVVTRSRNRRWWRASELRLLRTVAAHVGKALGSGRMVDELAASVEDLERLAALVTASDDAIIGVRPDGTISSWNRGAEVLLGYQAADVVDKDGDTLGAVAGYSALRDAFARAREGVLVRDLHADALRKDGSIVPIAVTMSPVLSEDGQVRAVSIIARDETPQALHTTALRQSLDRFQRVFEGSPVGIGVIGQDFTWLRVNDALCRALGRPEQDLVGYRFERSVMRDDIEGAHGLVSRLLRGESEGSSAEVRLRPGDTAGGQSRIAALAVRPLRTADGAMQALCTVEDVTESRLAEERGRATEAAVQRAILAMTAIREPEGILRVLLSASRSILSASAATVVYHDPDAAAPGAVVKDGSDDAFRPFASLIEHERALARTPALTSPSGLAPFGSGGGAPLLRVQLSLDDLVTGTLFVAGKEDGQDFTEGDHLVAVALATHAALSLENAHAHQRALALVHELDGANIALQRASEAKTRFVATASHELRTPLHSILLAAQLLREPGSTIDRHKVRELPQLIEGSGRHLLGLIDDLVDLSRIELSDVRLRLTDVRLAAVLDDVRRQLRPVAAERGVRLRIASGRGLDVHADPLRLRQVLINLLTNAVKYTDAGGKVVVLARATGSGVVIDVRDTGIGIEPHDLERAFEPFERLGRDGVPGAGLGLSIARRIVELHGGTLTARSTPGRGSTFTIHLPDSGGPAAPGPELPTIAVDALIGDLAVALGASTTAPEPIGMPPVIGVTSAA